MTLGQGDAKKRGRYHSLPLCILKIVNQALWPPRRQNAALYWKNKAEI